MRSAQEDADARKHFPGVSIAVNVGGTLLAEIGRNEEAIRWFEDRMKQKKLSHAAAHRYAWLLYERGDAGKACQVMEQTSPGPRNGNPSRVIFVAESPNGGLDR